MPIFATAADKPGGHGRMRPSTSGIVCFTSSSRTVPQVCGDLTAHYKLSTLMGDPLGNYGLTWVLSSFQIADADGKNSQTYQTTTVPSAIAEAAQKIELSVKGAAVVNGSKVMLLFDTGAAVKPGGEISFNTPSGYNWDKFLVADAAAENNWGCKRKEENWVSAPVAKGLMRGGIHLSSFVTCPGSLVNVGALDRAIATFCEANPTSRERYCLKEVKKPPVVEKVPTDPFAALDKPAKKEPGATIKARESDPFASLESGSKARDNLRPSNDITAALEGANTERLANIERKRRYDAAYASCETDLAAQQSCEQDRCGEEPPKEACTRVKWGYTNCKPTNGQSCINLPKSECVEWGDSPWHAKWETCTKETSLQCAVGSKKKITSLEACASERM